MQILYYPSLIYEDIWDNTEITSFAEVHTTTKWQSWDWNLASPEPVLWTLLPKTVGLNRHLRRVHLTLSKMKSTLRHFGARQTANAAFPFPSAHFFWLGMAQVTHFHSKGPREILKRYCFHRWQPQSGAMSATTRCSEHLRRHLAALRLRSLWELNESHRILSPEKCPSRFCRQFQGDWPPEAHSQSSGKLL